ncbi:hypothetical protein [Dehalococcoides mccartyi]|jgi:hypothetical protein|uniref:hypothetical protein n=1 Tax=Dehalococcoides mccartyi TaxID=61435 RepID=UPI0008710C9F|nr:hypothetical protein [Dehalococcoides mccartyi]AOV99539.1 hypothetical protein DCWBC2_0907 [Dehalococcoides mccartyi]
MVTKTKSIRERPYSPQDKVKLEYIPYLLQDMGITAVMDAGFCKAPQAWLSANATKDLIYQIYDDIIKREIVAETTMSELGDMANMFYTGYEVAQYDISQIFKIPENSSLKDGHVW